MVKVGFICEGETEVIILESPQFQELLREFKINPINIINAGGCGNLLPHNIDGYVQSLESHEVDTIIILTDLDKDACITKTKQRILARPQDILIISVQQIEAWFLACTEGMRTLLANDSFHFAFPENETAPFDTINSLLIAHTGRGIGRSTGGKLKLANRLIKNGLDLREAAKHPNCPSAKYFLKKLGEVGSIS